MSQQISVCPEVWKKDIKQLRKRIERKLTDCQLTPEVFELASDATRLASHKVTDVVSNYISQIDLENRGTLVDTQPFLAEGWKLFKIRYGVTSDGPRKGLRVLVAKSIESSAMVIIFMAMKKDCANEATLQKTVNARFKQYIR